MKPSGIALAMVFSVFVALGQGTILFTNLGQGLEAPVRNAAGELVPAGPVQLGNGLCGVYYAILRVGKSPTNLTLEGAPASLTFKAVPPLVSQPGYFGVGQAEVVLDGFVPGSHPWFRVDAWCYADFCGTFWELPGEPIEFGSSQLFQLDPSGPGLGGGSPPAPAPTLLGMKPFQLSPSIGEGTKWLGFPYVSGTNVVLYWYGGPATAIRTFNLQVALHPEGPWNIVTNARSPYYQPRDQFSTVFFRVAEYLRLNKANQSDLANGSQASGSETNVASSAAGSGR